MERLNLFVGTYGQGLVPLIYRPADDRLEPGQPVPAIANASYGAFDPKRGLHYFVDEEDKGTVGVWRLADGRWQCLLVVPSHGEAPCFVSLDAGRWRMAVANYQSGQVAIYRLDDDGLPAGDAEVHANTGHGPNPERQDGPHAHCVRFHNDWLYQTDLGTDQVLAYAPDGSRSVAFGAPPGQGPRHILFHPRLEVAYLVTELGSRLLTLDIAADGRLTERHSVSTLPPDAPPGSLGGHIGLNRAGDRLYVTNRGHDSVATFAVADDGSLDLMDIALTHGKSPRHFHLIEDYGRMLVAHEEGNSVVMLALNGDGTVAGLCQTLSMAQPAFIGILFTKSPAPFDPDGGRAIDIVSPSER